MNCPVSEGQKGKSREITERDIFRGALQIPIAGALNTLTTRANKEIARKDLGIQDLKLRFSVSRDWVFKGQSAGEFTDPENVLSGFKGVNVRFNGTLKVHAVVKEVPVEKTLSAEGRVDKNGHVRWSTKMSKFHIIAALKE